MDVQELEVSRLARPEARPTARRLLQQLHRRKFKVVVGSVQAGSKQRYYSILVASIIAE